MSEIVIFYQIKIAARVPSSEVLQVLGTAQLGDII